MKPKLGIAGLELLYGDLHALRGITMQIAPAEIVALIGPSGCGKSALLGVLNRMTGPDAHLAGSVELDGQDIYRDLNEYELRRRVGMIFARPNVFPMSIYDNIAFGPRVNGERRRPVLDEMVETALTEAELWDEVKDRLRSPALRLSEGQQQRLCIARALALQPEVLLLDEPTSSLDPIATGRIEQLLERLSQRMAILLVTHAVQQASRISDRTAFFLHGELVECGRTEEMFVQPRQQSTADYISGRFQR
ncbi:phosphate ABC transporter ATP-binding protein [Spirochaeta africana]|uniref:ABC-type phosphate transport system, ATPase component n=1 Tax=Spirochaeta africana (strain ATCC 700263 / DSM 8902 / Z-7692) TaxID=889378 RepID=H9UGU6_SPIAZ|nr:phosphate ABC transporter ATP-binding protein [Spirochaeta africana]AFG36739.1 ABC-type phosphate transport system, ATPase component [Spirochaeta africana DSM 8902]